MKIYKLPQLTEASSDDICRLAADKLGASALYLLYGRLHPGGPPHTLAPGKGREEIFYLVKGTISLQTGKGSFPINAGECFHMGEDDSMSIDNRSDEEAVFIICGAATDAGSPD
ncbi:MAG TPA: hypothetical protein ENJ37_03620 [Deltaproteobacteria bacterium]|nr:hypothetical protein [Deltaproteobacteria bacterium]